MTTLVPTNETLMKGYLSGEVVAFEELYKRLSPKVYGYLLKRTSSRADAEEILQMVFLKFHRSRNQYNPTYPVLQWIFVISKSALLDFYRKNARQVVLDHSAQIEKVSEVVVKESATHALVNESLETLPDNQKQIIKWRYDDDLSYEEIARKLNKSETTVRQTLSRAIRKLRNSIQGNRGEI